MHKLHCRRIKRLYVKREKGSKGSHYFESTNGGGGKKKIIRQSGKELRRVKNIVIP